MTWRGGTPAMLLMAATWVGAFVRCQARDPLYSFPLELAATDDRGDPVAGVEARSRGRSLGRSGASGRLEVNLRGQDGDRLEVQVVAPRSHRLLTPASVPCVLQLAAPLGGAAATPQAVRIVARLAPGTRRYAVLVLTDGRAHLPVLIGGTKQVATDAWGVAQFLYEAPPGGSLAVGIDTRTWPSLLPASPVRLFALPDRDDVLLMRQEFRERRVLRKSPAKRRGRDPTRGHPPRRL